MKDKLERLYVMITQMYDDGLIDYNQYYELIGYMDYIFESELG